MTTLVVQDLLSLVQVTETETVVTAEGGNPTTALFAGIGSSGLVPDPGAGDADRILQADGSWATQSGAGGTLDHGALTGLADDDHIQYLLADGTRALTGNLDLGSNDVTNVGNVDGRDVSVDGSKLDGIEAGATGDLTGSEIKILYEAEADTNAFTDADESKLDGIEAGATGDQTGGEIKTLYEGEADTNAFTDADESKLDGIEAAATADQTGAEIKSLYEAEANTNAFTDADESKLDGIEAGATGDQTDSEIALAYDNEVPQVSGPEKTAGTETDLRTYSPLDIADMAGTHGGGGGGVTDHGALTGLADDDHTQYLLANGTRALSGNLDLGANDIINVANVDGRDVSADGSKLDGIEAGATADQTGAEIKAAYEGEANTNAFTDADESKLDGIEAGANNYSHPNHTGDVTSVGDGAQTIANDAVTNAKAADMAANTIKARNAGTSGDPQDVADSDLTEEASPGSGDLLFGWDNLGNIRKFDVGNLPTGGGGESNEGANVGTGEDVFRDKTGISLNFRGINASAPISAAVNADNIDVTLDDDGVTDAKLRNSSALSVIGRAANSLGDPADIAAGSDGQVLRRSGTSLAFGEVATAGIADEAVTLAKLEHIATASLLGRDTGGAGDVEVLSASEARTLLNVEDGATADQTGAEIKSLYEAEANTNAFTDADESKLDGIEAGATGDQTAADIRALGFFDTSNDGTGSGLDSDLLDGSEGAFYLDRANHTGTQVMATISDAGDLATLDTVGATEIDNDAVTDAKLANMPASTIKANITGGSADPANATSDEIRTLLGGALVDQGTFDAGGGGSSTFPGSGSARKGDVYEITNAAASGTTLGSTNTFDVWTGARIVATADNASATDGSDWNRLAAVDRVFNQTGEPNIISLTADATPDVDDLFVVQQPAGSYRKVEIQNLPVATVSVPGYLSASDKSKLDGIEAGATSDMNGSEILEAVELSLSPTDGSYLVFDSAGAGSYQPEANWFRPLTNLVVSGNAFTPTMAAGTKKLQTVDLDPSTGNITANSIASQVTGGELILIIIGDSASNRNITWPAGWNWVGPELTFLPAGQYKYLSLYTFGSLDSEVVAVPMQKPGGIVQRALPTSGASATIDFSAVEAIQEHTAPSSGTLTVSSSNLNEGVKYGVRIIGDPSSDIPITWPAGWNWRTYEPQEVKAGEEIWIEANSRGSTDGEVYAIDTTPTRTIKPEDLVWVDETLSGAPSLGEYPRHNGVRWDHVPINNILQDLLSVDGPSSGLDADTVDGLEGADLGELAGSNSWTGTNFFADVIDSDKAIQWGSESITVTANAFSIDWAQSNILKVSFVGASGDLTCNASSNFSRGFILLRITGDTTTRNIAWPAGWTWVTEELTSIPDDGGSSEERVILLLSSGVSDAEVFAAWLKKDSTIDHGGLSGLSDDDHTQYLLADGTRALSGNLDLDSNNLLNVGTIGANLNSIADVSYAGAVSGGQILVAIGSVWFNVAGASAFIPQPGSRAAFDLIQYNGSAWNPVSIAELIPAIQLRRTGGTLTANSATLVDVTFNNAADDDVWDGGDGVNFSWDNTTNPEEITCEKAGRVKISFKLNGTQTSGNARAHPFAVVQRDAGGGFAELPGTRITAYSRNATFDEWGISMGEYEISISAGDKLKLSFANVSSGVTIQTNDDECWQRLEYSGFS